MNPLKSRVTDPRYGEPVIPPYLIAFLVDLADQRGWDAQPWFAGLGINPEQCIEPDARLSFRQAATVIRRALAATREPALGLLVGSRESLSSCGVVGFAMMSAPTFGAAMALIDRYHTVTGSLMDQRVEVHGQRAALIAVERFPEPDLLPFFCEELFACALQVARALLGIRVRPSALEFTFKAPPWAARYAEAFGCPLRFDASANRMLFEAELLERRLASADPTTHAAALRLCTSESRQAHQPADHVTALQFWLRERMGTSVRVGDAAKVLNMSERTLRRRLAEAGTCFQDLHDHSRTEQASRLLGNTKLSVAQVAEAMGFSDGREFRRAFKRWTGSAPQTLRDRSDN